MRYGKGNQLNKKKWAIDLTRYFTHKKRYQRANKY